MLDIPVREPKGLDVVKQIVEPTGDQKLAFRRQLAHKEAEDGSLVHCQGVIRL
jgi:hypothetical protein